MKQHLLQISHLQSNNSFLSLTFMGPDPGQPAQGLHFCICQQILTTIPYHIYYYKMVMGVFFGGEGCGGGANIAIPK